jgi:hypothetical protein
MIGPNRICRHIGLLGSKLAFPSRSPYNGRWPGIRVRPLEISAYAEKGESR